VWVQFPPPPSTKYMLRVLTLLILSILISSCSPSADRGFKYIEPEELKKWQAEKREFLLIDVRGLEPFLEEHIEGAVPLPENGAVPLPKNQSVPRKDMPIVLYCWSNGTSVEVAKSLRGYNIYILNGGIYKWKGIVSPPK